MNEVIALESQIMDALPRADAAAGNDASAQPLLAAAHEILCNGWSQPGSRLDRLRTIVAELRRFA